MDSLGCWLCREPYARVRRRPAAEEGFLFSSSAQPKHTRRSNFSSAPCLTFWLLFSRFALVFLLIRSLVSRLMASYSSLPFLP